MTLFPSHITSMSTEVSSEFIYIQSLVHHGTEGKSLLLAVETRFTLDKADIQGTWSHTRPSGTRTTLVTFTKNATIRNMMYRERLLLKVPSFSLLIHKLQRDDEGDYHLSLNIEFHNRTGLVMKEERMVQVTVDGEFRSVSVLLWWWSFWYVTDRVLNPSFFFILVPVSSPVIMKSPTHAVIEDKANVTWTCSVERGTRVVFQWLRDNVPLGVSDRYHFSKDNSTLLISPAKKEDRGTYHCVASNAVSQGRHSRSLGLSVYCE